MGSIGTFAEQRVAAPPAEVFALFAAGAGAGWLFDAACDAVRPGAAITLELPLVGAGGHCVSLLGRIARVVPDRRIEVVHHVPWHGRLRLLFDPDPVGSEPATRVRVIADIDGDGIAWLLRHRGIHLREAPDPDEHPVGVLLTLSGPGSVFTGAAAQLATMASEEINADGGIRGQRLRLLVGDDATDPEVGASEALRLVRAGCRTVIAVTTSATFARVAAILAGRSVLLVQSLMNEGGRGAALTMQLGERPQQQLEVAVGPLMRLAGGNRWFLAGNDYVWPRRAHAAARRVLDQRRAVVTGEGYAPLGTTDFVPLIERILASGSDLVLSSFVGADLVAFERQCHLMGVRDRCTSLALTLDEGSRERIGDTAAAGVWAVSGYFPEADTPENHAFLSRYRARFGDLAPPLSTFAESLYEALHLYAGAARRAGEDDPHAIARQLRSCRADLPRGTVVVEGPETVRQDLHLAEAAAGGFRIRRTG